MRNALMISALLVIGFTRLIPHPPNFTPILAMALFAGAYTNKFSHGLFILLGTMLVTDFFIGFYSFMPWIYLSLLAPLLIGKWLGFKKPLLPIGGGSLLASLVFFLGSNFAVWKLGTMYPISWEGLVACYTAAIPFFKNTLLSTFSYSILLFGGFRALEKILPEPIAQRI